jgi:hypothetical protein
MFAQHEIGGELKAMSQWLDGQPALIGLLAGDLRRLIGGTGTDKSRLAIGIARGCIRGGARGRFYTVVGFRQPTGERGPQWSARPSG